MGVRVRIGEVLELMATLATRFYGVIVRVEQDQSYYQWIVQPSVSLPDRQLNPPVYHLMVGVLRELLYWASGGKSYFIEQKDGDGVGSSGYTIAIARRPLE